MNAVTRSQMIKKVGENVEKCKKQYAAAKAGSFAETGIITKLARAQRLLRRVEAGQRVSVREVVAYFGAGARMLEE